MMWVWRRMVYGMMHHMMPVMYDLAVVHRMMYLRACKAGDADK